MGKTSLLRMLCGLAPIEVGDIRWRGVSIRSQAEVYRQDLFYLGHLNALQESMTVNENIVFFPLHWVAEWLINWSSPNY